MESNNIKLNMNDDLIPRMKEIAKLSLQSVYKQMDPNRLENTFEIFGLDFMIDENNKLILIEINTNPDITTCCTLL